MKKKILIICSLIIGITLVGWSIFYYSNHGKKNGEYISYYDNGQIKEKGFLDNGKRNGEWITYYENGQIQFHFEGTVAYGEIVAYYENGQIKRKGSYKNGELDGEIVAYYENGKLKRGGNVENGKQEGERIGYYESGQIKEKENYKNGEYNGNQVYYYENGEIKGQMNFKNGILDGKYTHHFEDGKFTEMNYKNGKEDGKQIGYYEDGSVRFLHDFKDGFGTKSFFDKKGNVIGTGTEIYTDEMNEDGWFYKSILNGLEILYYENGQAHEISNYKNGELDGTQTLYYENGQIESICNYIDGTLSGECTVYDEDGEVITVSYTDGDIIEGTGNGTFAQHLPDSVEISVEDYVIMGERVNLKIKAIKNGKKMDNYNGTIWMWVSDEDGSVLKDYEYTVPSRGMYRFLSSDLGEKEFQKGLEINKEGTFYIEIYDLDDIEERLLGKKLIHVLKANKELSTYEIIVLQPENNSDQRGNDLSISAVATELPNTEAVIYIDGKKVDNTYVTPLGEINYTVGDIEAGNHTLLIEIPDMEGNIMGSSKKIYFITSPADND